MNPNDHSLVPFDPTEFKVVGREIHTHGPLCLPNDLCVMCGRETTSGRTFQKKLHWTPSWVILTIFINLLVLLIVNMITRKTLSVEYHLCIDCQMKTNRKMAYSAVGTFATLVAFFVGVQMAEPALMLAAGGGFFVALLTVIHVSNPPLKPKMYEGGTFRIAGGSQKFLEKLEQRRRGYRAQLTTQIPALPNPDATDGFV